MKNELDLFKEIWERETAKTIKLLDRRALLRKSAREHDSARRPWNRSRAGDGRFVRRGNDSDSDSSPDHRSRIGGHLGAGNALLRDDLAAAREADATPAAAVSADCPGLARIGESDFACDPRRSDGAGTSMGRPSGRIQRDLLVAVRSPL